MNEKRRVVYVGFGANLGDPLDTYTRAVSILESTLGPVRKESLMYESGALTLEGTASQTNYFNAVITFTTELSPHEILSVLLETEALFKRRREEATRWAPRPIDLDILFIENVVLDDERLTIPHPELHKRDFVLRPLLDVAPDFIHPTLGETVSSLESSLEVRGCKRLIVRSLRVPGRAAPESVETRCEHEDTELTMTEPPALL